MANQFNGDGTPVGGYAKEYEPPKNPQATPTSNGTPVTSLSNPAFPNAKAPEVVVPVKKG